MCFSFPPSLTMMHLCITQCRTPLGLSVDLGRGQPLHVPPNNSETPMISSAIITTTPNILVAPNIFDNFMSLPGNSLLVSYAFFTCFPCLGAFWSTFFYSCVIGFLKGLSICTLSLDPLFFTLGEFQAVA